MSRVLVIRERRHKMTWNSPIRELGEKILYMPAEPARGENWGAAVPHSVGMLGSSSEVVVVTEQGLAIKTKVGEHQESARVGDFGR